jgi:hypothetical protein
VYIVSASNTETDLYRDSMDPLTDITKTIIGSSEHQRILISIIAVKMKITSLSGLGILLARDVIRHHEI